MSNSSDSLAAKPRLDGLVPERLTQRTRMIVLQDYDLNLDIGPLGPLLPRSPDRPWNRDDWPALAELST